jgi:hypothetical protein
LIKELVPILVLLAASLLIVGIPVMVTPLAVTVPVRVLPFIVGVVKVLAVNVSVPSRVAKSLPVNAVLNSAIVPVNLVATIAALAFTSALTIVPSTIFALVTTAPEIVPEIVGEVKVLLVNVSVPSRVAKSLSVRAVLNCAVVPETVLLLRETVLLVRV